MFRTSIKLSFTGPEFYYMQKVEVFESVFEVFSVSKLYEK